jgi:hypothetical protein
MCYARSVRQASRTAWWGMLLAYGLGLMAKPAGR